MWTIALSATSKTIAHRYKVSNLGYTQECAIAHSSKTIAHRYKVSNPLTPETQRIMELVLCNTQSELHPLEEGKHAAESGMDLKQYAERSGKARPTLQFKAQAFKVSRETQVEFSVARDSWRNLAEIHAAPQWLWSALVKAMLEAGWTVATTRDKVGAFKDAAEPPAWADKARVAEKLSTG